MSEKLRSAGVRSSQTTVEITADYKHNHREKAVSIDNNDSQDDVADKAVEFHEKVSGIWSGLYDTSSSMTRRATWMSQLINYALENKGYFGEQHWLDAGCGAGNISALLLAENIRVTGVDASVGMIENAQVNVKHELGRFIHISTVESMAFQDASFEGVMCSSVLEYVKNVEACLQEFKRVTKPGGMLIVTFPNSNSVVRLIQKIIYKLSTYGGGKPMFEYVAFSRNSYKDKEIRSLLLRNGYEVLELQSFSPLLGMSVLPSFKNSPLNSLLAVIAIRR